MIWMPVHVWVERNEMTTKALKRDRHKCESVQSDYKLDQEIHDSRVWQRVGK